MSVICVPPTQYTIVRPKQNHWRKKKKKRPFSKRENGGTQKSVAHSNNEAPLGRIRKNLVRSPGCLSFWSLGSPLLTFVLCGLWLFSLGLSSLAFSFMSISELGTGAMPF